MLRRVQSPRSHKILGHLEETFKLQSDLQTKIIIVLFKLTYKKPKKLSPNHF
jgi:hypothetical protein